MQDFNDYVKNGGNNPPDGMDKNLYNLEKGEKL